MPSPSEHGVIDPRYITSTVQAILRQIHAEQYPRDANGRLTRAAMLLIHPHVPILADALEEAGENDPEFLRALRRSDEPLLPGFHKHEAALRMVLDPLPTQQAKWQAALIATPRSIGRHNAEYKNLFFHMATGARFRRNGATQTWKRTPGAFRIPVKHGLHRYGQITDCNAHEWHTGD